MSSDSPGASVAMAPGPLPIVTLPMTSPVARKSACLNQDGRGVNRAAVQVECAASLRERAREVDRAAVEYREVTASRQAGRRHLTGRGPAPAERESFRPWPRQPIVTTFSPPNLSPPVITNPPGNDPLPISTAMTVGTTTPAMVAVSLTIVAVSAVLGKALNCQLAGSIQAEVVPPPSQSTPAPAQRRGGTASPRAAPREPAPWKWPSTWIREGAAYDERGRGGRPPGKMAEPGKSAVTTKPIASHRILQQFVVDAQTAASLALNHAISGGILASRIC